MKVFNYNAPINVTLSPERHADRVGLPYTLYVVERKSADEWVADPTLVDVSGDGADTIFMAAGSAVDNTEPLFSGDVEVTSEQLRAFDVILDFDMDGTLSPGDIAMGPGDSWPGITVMGNLHEAGPHDVESFTYSGGSWLDQIVYMPEDIEELSDVPVVIISHGNGHNYLWYDYLGEHLASHGYVVMSHSNWTGPGIEYASYTTLENTDYFLYAVEAGLADGVLDGRIDPDNIVWIGHSRGGEGVARAYDRIVDEGYDTDFYDENSISLISSIAPTVFYTVDYSNPHDRPYHLFAGGADGDVHGAPSNSVVMFFRLTSVALAEVQTTYLHGVGHNEFNCCGFADATGPALIGRPATQDIAKAYYLALIRAYADGHMPSMDYISRRADVFRPPNLTPSAVITNEYRPDKDVDAVVLDDFQSASGDDEASSGAAVSYTVDNFYEGFMDDANDALSIGGSDPMSGMTQGCCEADENDGAIFSFDENASVEWRVEGVLTDWSGFTFLSFRAAQGSRHPLTSDLDDDLSFTATLVDAAGEEASIPWAEWGQITKTYGRTGYGAGAGWANEFNTIRLRLTAFAEVNPALNLGDIATLRFDVGPDHGSAVGRVAIDDVLLEY